MLTALIYIKDLQINFKETNNQSNRKMSKRYGQLVHSRGGTYDFIHTGKDVQIHF